MCKYFILVLLSLSSTRCYTQSILAKPLIVTAIYDDSTFKFFYPLKIEVSPKEIKVIDAKDTSKNEFVVFRIVQSLTEETPTEADYLAGYNVVQLLPDSTIAQARAKFYYRRRQKNGVLKVEYLNSEYQNRNFEFVIIHE